MNERDDFALVPKPRGALEKTEPGVRRILSGVVADTLALARKKPVRIVIVDDEDSLLEITALIIRHLFKNVEVLTFGDPRAALQELEQRDPDLLITDDRMPYMEGIELISRLMKRRVVYPMVLYGGASPAQYVARLGNPNVSSLDKPFTPRQLVEIVATRLSLTPERATGVASQPLVARPLRIVMLDDDSTTLDVFECIVRLRFKDAIVLKFDDAEDALKELERESPDVFTTDWFHPEPGGSEILRLLAARKATFPVLVMSGNATEELVREHTPPNISVTFLRKPCASKSYLMALELALKVAHVPLPTETVPPRDKP